MILILLSDGRVAMVSLPMGHGISVHLSPSLCGHRSLLREGLKDEDRVVISFLVAC